MAAAYATLTSLKQIILNLHNHPFPPIPTDKQQVRSLTEVITFLQEFLKGYNSSYADSDEADPLETRIVDVAFNAEDVIESKIVDQLRSQSTNPGKATGDDLYQHLQFVIEEMELIKNMAIMTIQTDNTPVRPQLRRNVPKALDSSMVGFDDVILQVLKSLVGSQLELQIIPIIGMGGIGKTTLARNIFENACVQKHFDIHAWITISQVYNAQQALKDLLSQTKGNSCGKSESELGLELYQYLWGRRYLIVMDDVWSIEVWIRISHYFPTYKDGSRVIITSRLSGLLSHFNNGFNMKFLNYVDSWNLLSKTVFGEESFPLEFKDIGKNIARKCRGLPLSIVIIGGLLAKSKQTREYWEHIEENLNSIVNSKDDDYCLRILKMSYNHLPVHLKPCFLYMGIFKEDRRVLFPEIINKWISEGFIEPTSDKSLETIAEENLKELVDRNLILCDVLPTLTLKIHDLLRDLCIREAEKCGFYVYAREHFPQDINSTCRIIIDRRISNEKFLEASKSLSGAISIISIIFDCAHGIRTIMPFKLRLLGTIKAFGEDNFLRRNLFEIANSRYISIKRHGIHVISSLNLFWNLHTLIVHAVTGPIDIWNMPQLRHVRIKKVYLPDPPTDHDIIMENLQTLENVLNLKLSQEVVKRIPSIKTLNVQYDKVEPHEDFYCLNYLEYLHKLESFCCLCLDLEVDCFLKKLTFPQSLQKLRIILKKNFELEEMLEKISALPLLVELSVSAGFFRTMEWRTVEGQFCRLESLELLRCGGLERWTLERSHFPLLKKVSLFYLEELKEISSEIGEIATLQSIYVSGCKMSVAMCLKKIVEEQEEYQGVEELPFKVKVSMRRSDLLCSKSKVEFVCTESNCRNESVPHFHSFVSEIEANALERLNGPNFHIRLIL